MLDYIAHVDLSAGGDSSHTRSRIMLIKKLFVFSFLAIISFWTLDRGLRNQSVATTYGRVDRSRITYGTEDERTGQQFHEVSTLTLYKQSPKKVSAFLESSQSFLFALYSAKTSGSTGKTLYRNMGGARDVDNFMNLPLTNRSISFTKKQNFFASHYTCARKEVSRLLRLGKPEMLVLFPIRESTSLIQSAVTQVSHRLCHNPERFGFNKTFKSDGACDIPRHVLLETILSTKMFEMGVTHIDCLDFADLKVSLAITRSRVCFGDLKVVNSILTTFAELRDAELKTVNIAAEKEKIVVSFGNDLEPVGLSDFLDYNWPKIAAGLRYNITSEHRWLENLVIEHPETLFCNRAALS